MSVMTSDPVEAAEQVIRVDGNDRPLGPAGKLEVHQTGELHRAVSVFLVDRSGRLLLQRRALSKYHSPGLWANACCGHPRPGEAPLEAAARRLQEEVGLKAVLFPAFTTLYDAPVGAGLREHEFVHVFFGRHDGPATPNPDEVAETAWRSPEALVRELDARHAVWLHHYMDAHGGDVRTWTARLTGV